MAEARIGQHGKIAKVDGGYTVQIKGMPHLLEVPGVVCGNPSAPEPQRVYSKTFTQKPIYLAPQLGQARKEVLGGRDTLVVGMTGYSRLTDEQCRDWGIKPGAYEEACMDVLGTTIFELQKEYPGIRPKIVHGASDMGVDRAVIEVANAMNLDQLGHSCPEYLFYVQDDGVPVYVAPNRQAYSDEFINSLDVLLSVGGRVQALEHDISAAVRQNKHVVLLNILRSLSNNGNPPARDGNGNVVDATAAFEEAIAMMGGDPQRRSYEEIRTFAAGKTKTIARRILAPQTSYGHWRRNG